MNSHNLFNEFLDTFFVKKNSFLSDETSILSFDSLDENRLNIVEDNDTSNRKFDVKIREQFEDSSKQAKIVFLHAYWLWSLGSKDLYVETKINQINKLFPEAGVTIKEEKTSEGFASTGIYHKTKKDEEIRFILTLFMVVFDCIESEASINEDQIRKVIIDTCLFQRYKDDKYKSHIKNEDRLEYLLESGQLAMPNIILHLCAPEKYVDIVSNKQKNQIVAAFLPLIGQEDLDEKNTDEKIFIIKERIKELKNKDDIKFYSEDIAALWKSDSTSDEFTCIEGLNYKKAIILYGPPGTSKTYSAYQLAKFLINQSFIKRKRNLKKVLSGEFPDPKDNIHKLQLHPSYSYEDFIIGYQFKNNDTVLVKGSFAEICDKARKDINEDPRDTIPHVLILDEINRTDLSKLFGEVFSALEKRGEEFDLSIKGETLNVPENLYIIGTMNEIDFSLEQIDFALRRRFLWYFYGFNEDRLRKIINEKSKKSPLGSDKKQAELEIFINNVSKLNEAISMSPVLGEQFQIGHTFFAELVDIYNSFINIEGKKTPKIYYSTKDKNRDEGPAFVLWTISIEPMLNAFLGNLDEDEKNDVIGKFKEIYMGNGAE